MRRRRRVAAALAVDALLSGSLAFGQVRFFRRYIPYATAKSFDGAFNFCRVYFRQAANGDGGDWQVDYPRADSNLMTRLSELTKASISRTRFCPTPSIHTGRSVIRFAASSDATTTATAPSEMGDTSSR